jgi:hypothetical protein
MEADWSPLFELKNVKEQNLLSPGLDTEKKRDQELRPSPSKKKLRLMTLICLVRC